MTRSLALRPLRPRPLACLLAGMLAIVGACAVAGPSSRPPEQVRSLIPSATPTVASAATPPTTPTRSLSPSPTPSPSVPSVPTTATPPPASLSAEGGDPVAGQLGSYTWGDVGSDSPWLPGAPLAVGAREPLAVTFGGGPAVASWTARRARAGATSPVGAVPAGGGAGPVAIDAPAAGSWTLAVTVEFAGGIGSATWYWRLDVR